MRSRCCWLPARAPRAAPLRRALCLPTAEISIPVPRDLRSGQGPLCGLNSRQKVQTSGAPSRTLPRRPMGVSIKTPQLLGRRWDHARCFPVRGEL